MTGKTAKRAILSGSCITTNKESYIKSLLEGLIIGSFKVALIGYLLCHLFYHLFEKEDNKESDKWHKAA
jgi:predicted membrane channel-forming protein YqfA (hemolysin III family)